MNLAAMAGTGGRPGRRPSYADLEALVAEQAAQLAQSAVQIAELKGENAALGERVAELERRLNRDSRNSSMPPSADPPKSRQERRAEARRRARDSLRAAGGQPGHEGASRQMAPPERVDRVFEVAFEQLRGADPHLRPPRRWFVVEDPEPNACAYADTLMVTRGMLESPSFPAVLAHELGHLNSSDARVSAALVRITTPPRNPVEFPFRLLAYLISGRIGIALMRNPWAMYWRRREKIADSYAAKLGQGPALEAYLDTYALDGDLPIPFKDFGDTSHPWTEHRIDDLEAR